MNTPTILPSRALSRTPRGDRHPSLIRHRPVKLEIPHFRSQGTSGLLFKSVLLRQRHTGLIVGLIWWEVGEVGKKGSWNLLGVVDKEV